MDIIRRIIALENKLAYLENRHEPKVVHMRPSAPIWADFSATIPIERIEDAARSVMVPRDAEDDMA